jgi:hypothetical protein
MEGEFDRLDKSKNGQLDVKELAQSKFRVSHFASVGSNAGRALKTRTARPRLVALQFRPVLREYSVPNRRVARITRKDREGFGLQRVF